MRPIDTRTSNARTHRRGAAVAFITALFVTTAAVSSTRQSPPLIGILARSAVWIARYETELGSLIADERYWQEVGPVSGGIGSSEAPGRQGAGTVPPTAPETRETLSAFLMLQVPGTTPAQWAGFRDVYQVGRRAVRDPSPRFDAGLLQSSPARVLDYWKSLNAESARYNIGPVARTVNVPTFSLLVLRKEHQPRFMFRIRDEHARESDLDTVVIGFEERGAPTLISDPSGAAVFSSGRMWLTPGDGRVVRTELIMRFHPQRPPIGTISVRYATDQRLQAWVPHQMTETYFASGVRVHCAATYSNWRRFTTGTRIVQQH